MKLKRTFLDKNDQVTEVRDPIDPAVLVFHKPLTGIFRRLSALKTITFLFEDGTKTVFEKSVHR